MGKNGKTSALTIDLNNLEAIVLYCIVLRRFVHSWTTLD